jgi:hypothetical protein
MPVLARTLPLSSEAGVCLGEEETLNCRADSGRDKRRDWDARYAELRLPAGDRGGRAAWARPRGVAC